MVDIDVSCDDSVQVDMVKTTVSGRGTCAPNGPFFTECESLSVKGGVSRVLAQETGQAHEGIETRRRC